MPTVRSTEMLMGAPITPTITLASLADGAGRQAAMHENDNLYPFVELNVKIKSGANAPDDGAAYTLYLIRKRGNADDDAGDADAVFTPVNAEVIGSIRVTNDAATDFIGTMNTEHLGPLGPDWTFAVVNNSGQAISSTEADHEITFRYYR